jgi:amidase
MASATPVPAEREPELGELNRWLRERARALPAPDYIAACARLQRGIRSWLAATLPYDAVVTPTLALPPVPVGYFTGDGPQEEFRRMTAFTPFTSVFNVTGQPSMSVPLHHAPDGAPIGSMVTGRMGGEPLLLSRYRGDRRAAFGLDVPTATWRVGVVLVGFTAGAACPSPP